MTVVTIHQPEYLPYIGFFERLAYADVFVVFDDVNYQKNAFINRNRIKNAKSWQWITVPVKNRSSNLKINEVQIDNTKNWKEEHLRAIHINYSKSAYFEEYYHFFEEEFKKDWLKISDLDISLMENIIKFLGMNLKIVKSSELGIEGKSTERLIDICKKLKASSYLSGPGNEQHQVEKERFEKQGIEVRIRGFSNPEYAQMFMDQGFLPGMSILDLLFNCGPESSSLIKKN